MLEETANKSPGPVEMKITREVYHSISSITSPNWVAWILIPEEVEDSAGS